jgi:hypothetical protein
MGTYGKGQLGSRSSWPRNSRCKRNTILLEISNSFLAARDEWAIFMQLRTRTGKL